jgi:hypothetical protein
MSGFQVDFAFEIGDLVYVRGSTHTQTTRPKAFVVYERIAQECHGGVQRLYKVFGLEGLVPEPVLTLDIPPFQRRSALAVAEEIEFDQKMHEASMDRIRKRRS